MGDKTNRPSDFMLLLDFRLQLAILAHLTEPAPSSSRLRYILAPSHKREQMAIIAWVVWICKAIAEVWHIARSLGQCRVGIVASVLCASSAVKVFCHKGLVTHQARFEVF